MRLVVQIVLTFVLNALWQAAAIVAFAAACDWLLRELNPRYRHWLWVASLFACLGLPAISCLSLRDTPATRAERQTAVTPLVRTRILTPGVEELETSATTATLNSQPETQSRKWFAIPSAIRIQPKVALVLAALYALLVLWRFTNFVRAWRRTKAIVRSAFACTFSKSIQELIHQCRLEVGTKSCDVLCSAHVPLPIMVGVFRRRIILPQRFATEADADVLTSAIGHEFQHVARRDYLKNLIYEIVYLPLSFHPAAALARRRIRHTRELCCDAAVASRLIRPEVYARSLLSLVGRTPLFAMAPDTTIGINESEILEVRIMSLLKPSQPSIRRRALSLVGASLLLVMPCIAAAKFAFAIDTGKQEPVKTELPKTRETSPRVTQERAIVELARQASALKEEVRVAPQSRRAELEAMLREVERKLEEHKRGLERSAEIKDRLAQVMTEYPGDEAAMRQLKEKLAAEENAIQKDRKARLIYRTEPEYTGDAREKKIEGSVLLGFTIDHEGVPQGVQIKKSLYPSLDQAAVNSVRSWRFEPAMKDGQAVSMWVEAEVVFRLDYGAQSQEERAARVRREVEEREKVQSDDEKMLRGRIKLERAQREYQEKRNTQLARLAKISMDQAIQIATSKAPGKVFECRLVGERWEVEGDVAKPSLVMYHVVIVSGDDSNPATYHVMVNALDGSVVRTEKEEPLKEIEARQEKGINGGVLNGKALSLPPPKYPAIARAAHAEGDVQVRIMIDEGGNVIEAMAIGGHPLLQAAAVSAAREAKFAPTRLNGEPVRVSGLLVYNFVAK